jgi:hypothetical protein
MFRTRRWFERGRGRIESDEGFSIFISRDAIAYWEGRQKMMVTADLGAGQAVLFSASIGRWEGDLNHPVDDATRLRIENNIKRALEWSGWKVSCQ